MPTPSLGPSLSSSRRKFLQHLGAAGAALAARPVLDLAVPSALAGVPPVTPRNLIIFLTDQDRAIRWFPPGWAQANLPAYTQLQNKGLTFNRAYTNTCMCSPSRTTIFTGLFPAQHLSYDTLTEDLVQSLTEHQLDPRLPNLAKAFKSAGYEVIYKGKWHLSKGVESPDGTYIDDDLSRYGFDAWDPPDAGEDTAIEHYGGGTANNDTRFTNDALAYLQNRIDNPGGKPFVLVLSLVNPHDVLGYPGNSGGGYGPADLIGDIQLPPTLDENLLLNLKPTAQAAILAALAGGLGPLPTTQMKLNYINFYGNVMKLVDSKFKAVLDLLNGSPAGQALLADTLIVRTADHGEMGLTHGGLRQKAFLAYEEAVNIPLVYSNPQLFPSARTTDHLVSHVDLLPSLCAFFGVPNWEDNNFSGVNYSAVLTNPAAPPAQDYVLFTFDDINAGFAANPGGNGAVPAPNRIQMIRESDYKYSRYFDGTGVAPDQNEFYDLLTDVDPSTGVPVEMDNLSAWADNQRPVPQATPAQVAKRNAMAQRLADVTAARLQPRTLPPPLPPQNFQVSEVKYTDSDTGQPADDWEITWVSCWGVTYQLQQSPDLTTWTDVNAPVAGNNGPILQTVPRTAADRIFFRLQSTYPDGAVVWHEPVRPKAAAV